MKKFVIILSLLLLTFGCSDRNTPENVSSDFVYSYYQRANQEAALLLSDSLAAEKLRAEIELLHGIRKPSDPFEELPQILYEVVGKEVKGESLVFFRYKLTIKDGDSTAPRRNVIIQTELINEHWKVVNFDEYGD
jgi:hypothetical protein